MIEATDCEELLKEERAKNQQLQEKLGRLRDEHANLLVKYKAVKKSLSHVSQKYQALLEMEM